MTNSEIRFGKCNDRTKQTYESQIPINVYFHKVLLNRFMCDQDQINFKLYICRDAVSVYHELLRRVQTQEGK